MKRKRNTTYIERRDRLDQLQRMLDYVNVKRLIKDLRNDNLESICKVPLKLHYKLVSTLMREDIC